MSVKHKGRPLHKLTKQELIELVENLYTELRMVGSITPEDLKAEDTADWIPPKRVAQLYRGSGKAGGK